jgi:hypothetical protein
MADNLAHPSPDNRRKSFCCALASSPNDCRLIRCDIIGQLVTIDVLPDDAFLAVFDFYVVVKYQELDFIQALLSGCDTRLKIESWQSLVHVCRRWRGLVFASPRRLNLRLYCKAEVPVRDRLDIWPALPLVIHGTMSPLVVDNILALLKRHDRVSTIDLDYMITRQVEKVWAAMQVPFPELTFLRLWSYDLSAPIVPDSFLGGSSPRLREIRFNAVSFPGLPKLLLSATQLTSIHLGHITRSGYISPETMATSLSALTSLKSLYLDFDWLSRPDRESRHPPSPTRSILPALTDIQFKGTEEYLEDLVARIDAPQLNALLIFLVNQIDLGVPQLAQFISRTPIFKSLDEARVGFRRYFVRLTLSSPTFGFERLKIEIECRESGRRLSTLARVWTSFSPLLSNLDNFYIHEDGYVQPHWQDNIENNQWLELLLPLTAVESLYVSKEFVPSIAAALQELVRERMTEVLPTLRNLFLEELWRLGPARESIGLFIAARQLIGRPIALSLWRKDAHIL